MKEATAPLLLPPPPPPTKEEIAAIVKEAITQQLELSHNQAIKNATELGELRGRVRYLEEDKKKLEERVVEERKRGEVATADERRKGELAVAVEREKLEGRTRTLFRWETYTSGVEGGRRIPATSGRSVSG